MTGGDGEEVGCTKVSAKENNTMHSEFKVCCMNADWPEEGREKYDWTKPVMSQAA